MSRADDDALSWQGDDDPTLDVGKPDAARRAGADADADSRTDGTAVAATEDDTAVDADPVALPQGYTALGKGADDVGRIEADGSVTAPGRPAPMSNGTLIAIGVLAGIYLLYSIGWLIGGLRLQTTALFLVSPAAYLPALILAALAPAIWFLASSLLTRGSAAWVRFAWLAAGVLVLLPWPFVMIGAIGR